ncbi:MAG TPA: hypothetical protein PKZ53_09325 [Acidobacteriota bacterium]|nr:hypothetical protein [Acidobacteriota bacterium]
MMTTELEILKEICQKLERAGIDYMLTGSFAMIHYTQPRMNRNIDFVISLETQSLERFVGLFDSGFYLSKGAIQRAVHIRSMFNLIHLESIVKIDFVVLKNEPYQQEEFARRKRVPLADFEVWIVSLEDLILSKLIWAKPTNSELQLRDVKNLLKDTYDEAYLYEKARSLGVFELLEMVLRQ